MIRLFLGIFLLASLQMPVSAQAPDKKKASDADEVLQQCLVQIRAYLKKHEDPRSERIETIRLLAIAEAIEKVRGSSDKQKIVEAAIAISNVFEKKNPSKSSSGSKKKYTRKELRTLVVGKSKKEVLELLGRPNRTYEGGGVLGESWSYAPLGGTLHPFSVYDPIAKKLDRSLLIYFSTTTEKVDQISFP